MELEKIYNEIVKVRCPNCPFYVICDKLQLQGLDTICNNTLEIIAKEIEK